MLIININVALPAPKLSTRMLHSSYIASQSNRPDVGRKCEIYKGLDVEFDYL